MVSANSLPAKRLLERRGAVKLYEVLVANKAVYVVENLRESWRYSLLYSARSKFERLCTASAKENPLGQKGRC